MAHKFSASQLREYVQFFNQSNETDSRGKPTKTTDTLAFDCFAEVLEKSGRQLEQMGKTLDDSVVSVLTYFDWNVRSDQVMCWNGRRYEVDHIQPDESKKSMIVHCTLIGSQSYDPDFVPSEPEGDGTP